MKHAIKINNKVVRFYIGRCQRCEGTTTVRASRRGIICIDCMKKAGMHSRLEGYLKVYSSKTIIEGLREGKFEKVKLKKRIFNPILWDRCEPKKTDYYIPNRNF